MGTMHVVGNEDLCAPVPFRRETFEHVTLIRNESAGLHHLNRLCYTAGDTRPKKSHQGHG